MASSPVGAAASPKMKTPSQIKTEVWILRRDGSTVPRANTVALTPPELCTIGVCTAYKVLDFENAPADQIAGVVVSIDGKLYVRDFDRNPN